MTDPVDEPADTEEEEDVVAEGRCSGGAEGSEDGEDDELDDNVVELEDGTLQVPAPNGVDMESADREASLVVPCVPYHLKTQYTGGRVRALFIGINYTGQAKALKGCVNDVLQMINTLQAVQFPISECCILVDNPKFPNCTDTPTRANIIKYMKWLTRGLKPGDVLFFHYSGHGGQAKNRKDKYEKLDQTIFPLDYKEKGSIRDNDLYKLLVKPIPVGVRLTCTFDCCHSATVLDLPFEVLPTKDSDKVEVASIREDNYCHGDVVMISGCNDRQTCSDVRGRHGANGAATYAFTTALRGAKGQSYVGLLLKARESLAKRKMRQIPQMLVSKPIDLDQPFSLFGTFKVDEGAMKAKVPEKYQRIAPAALQYVHTPGDLCGTPPASTATAAGAAGPAQPAPPRPPTSSPKPHKRPHKRPSVTSPAKEPHQVPATPHAADPPPPPPSGKHEVQYVAPPPPGSGSAPVDDDSFPNIFHVQRWRKKPAVPPPQQQSSGFGFLEGMLETALGNFGAGGGSRGAPLAERPR